MKKSLALSTLALCCFASTLGCETLRVGAHAEQPLWVTHPSGSIQVEYRVPVMAGSRRFGEDYQRGRAEIDAKGKRLFVGSADNGLYCLDALTGGTFWRFEAAGPVQSAPLYDAASGALYFGAADGALYKVDASNGQLLFRFASNAEVLRRPVLSGGILYAINANDTILALDPKSGKLLWTQHRSPAMGMEISGHSGLLVWRGKVYAGFSDGTIVAYDARTGAERWQPVDLVTDSESIGQNEYLDVDTTPVADELDGSPVIYVASIQGGLFALDADSGTQVWSNPAVTGATELILWRQAAHPARDGGPALPARKLLIAATGTTGLWALDPESGAELWRTKLPAGGIAGPVPFGGALLASASQLGLFLLSPLDGRVIDGVHLTDGVSALVAGQGQRAFVLTNAGNLLALHVGRPGHAPSAEPNEIEFGARPLTTSQSW